MPEKNSYEALVERVDALEEERRRDLLYEEELRVERDRARDYLKLVQVIIVALNAKGKITLINPKGCRVLGWDESELIGRNWFTDCLPQPEGRQEVYPFFLKLMAGEVEGLNYFENPIITRRGERRYIAWQTALLRDNSGEIIGILSAGEDITEKRRAEEALRRSREELAEIFSMSLDMICVADITKNIFLKVNPAFTRVLGFSEDELLGRPFLDFVHPDDLQPTIDVIEEKLRKGKNVVDFTNRYRCRDGAYRCFEWVSHPVPGRGITFAVAHDITRRISTEEEKKRLERQLHQAHRLEAIGTLAGGIAHDFNNILMAIQGKVSLLATELEPGHPHLDYIAAIEEYIHSAGDLTKKLLGVAYRGKYEVSAVNVNQALESTAKMFGRTRKQLPIHSRLAGTELVVDADRQQLEQVFLSLFVNALQAMPDGGELFLETAQLTLDAAYCTPHEVPPGDYVKISITDTGIGMDKATCRRVFDPFFTTKEKSRGTGLGLAAVYGIIKNHGGMITLYSEPGHGTTFNIYLPLSRNAVLPKIPAGKELTSGSECILLVDDEKIIRDVAKAMLERMGYHVLAADGGEAATRIVSENGPVIDLVILDLIMPVIDGPATFRRIRELYPQMPVLLSSGYALNGAAEELLKNGDTWFIQKPYNIQVLSEKVRAVFGQKR